MDDSLSVSSLARILLLMHWDEFYGIPDVFLMIATYGPRIISQLDLVNISNKALVASLNQTTVRIIAVRFKGVIRDKVRPRNSEAFPPNMLLNLFSRQPTNLTNFPAYFRYAAHSH